MIDGFKKKVMGKYLYFAFSKMSPYAKSIQLQVDIDKIWKKNVVRMFMGQVPL